MKEFLVATLHLEDNPNSRYVKVTLEKEVTQIANFLWSCRNVKFIRFYTSNQDKALFDFMDSNFYYADETSTDIESFFFEILNYYHLNRMTNSFVNNTNVRIYNFWFSDDVNNLETFQRTIEHYGLDIDTLNWSEGSIYQECEECFSEGNKDD